VDGGALGRGLGDGDDDEATTRDGWCLWETVDAESVVEVGRGEGGRDDDDDGG